MGGTSTAVMTFVKAELLHSVRQNEEDSIWSGMRNSSLKVEPVSLLILGRALMICPQWYSDNYAQSMGISFMM